MIAKGKKKWTTPLVLSLSGELIEGGVVPIQEGEHMLNSLTGSLPGILIS